LYRWVVSGNRKINYISYYHDYLFCRSTLAQIAAGLDISVPTLRKHFDEINLPPVLKSASGNPVTIVVDATFFGREYGYLCFHDTKNIVYFEEIITESIASFEHGLNALITAGYRFASFTLDGKRGFLQLLKKRFPAMPIQMCHFHQKAIVRRYITNNPKTECGKDLKQLMCLLSGDEPQNFIDQFLALQEKHKVFLAEKNAAKKYVHTRIRSAIRSIKTNLPYLFVYKEINGITIPNTTNHLEGAFSHLKEKISIHRGLSLERKKNAIKFILSNA
jgi:hypothetical protein